MAHGVIRTDVMFGTDVCPEVRSARYMGSGSTATEIDNGNVVLLNGLMTGERELYKAVTPAANSAIDQIAIVATPEVMYDERKKNLDEFYNEAGAAIRVYRPHTHDVFSVTADALNIANGVTPAVGYAVELMAGTKLNVAASATNGSTQVGKLIAIEETQRYTYYVIEVA